MRNTTEPLATKYGESMTPQMMLTELSEELSQYRTLETLTDALAEKIRTELDADGATVVLRDGPFSYYVNENAITPLWKGKKFPLERCISGWAMLNRVPVAIADIYSDPRIPFDAYQPTFVKSLAMVPVRPAAPIAALGAYWAAKRFPTDEELAKLKEIAALAAEPLSAVI